MAYKFSKGSQVIGDLKSADDAERNTLIDFGEDQIDFQTSGSVRMQITNNGVQALNGNFVDSNGDIILGALYQLDDGLIQNPSSAYTRLYFPADDTLNETMAPSSVNYRIAPFAGELIKIQIKSPTNFSGKTLTAGFHRGTGTDNAYSATPVESISVSGDVSHTVYTYNFTGSTFSEGDIFGFSLELSQNWAGNESIHISSVVKFDPYA